MSMKGYTGHAIAKWNQVETLLAAGDTLKRNAGRGKCILFVLGMQGNT